MIRNSSHPLAPLATFAAVGAALLATACGGARRANEAPSKVLDLGGTRLSPGQVAGYLRGAGFPENAIGRMVCIAKYESSYYTGATNVNKGGSVDYGLFQINTYYWGAACGVSGSDLLNPAVNARCALKVFREQGYTAWYGYQYNRAECDATPAPGGAATGGMRISKTPNKLYSGLSRQSAFCSDIPVGTSVSVLSSHGSMYYVAVPSGVCKDWQGKVQTQGFVDASVVR